MQEIKLITVGQFIIRYGVEKLNHYPITLGGITYRITLNKDDLQSHNREVFIREHKRFGNEYFDTYHQKGNYRFYATQWDEEDNKAYCKWVYKSDLLIDYEYYIQHIAPKSKIINYRVNYRARFMIPELQYNVLPVKDNTNIEKILKAALQISSGYSTNGYYGEIIYQTEDRKWHYYKSYKPNTTFHLIHVNGRNCVIQSYDETRVILCPVGLPSLTSVHIHFDTDPIYIGSGGGDNQQWREYIEGIDIHLLQENLKSLFSKYRITHKIKNK